VLGDYTDRCIFSFIDRYAKIRQRTKGINDDEINEWNMNRIAEEFSKIAREHRMVLSTCSEKIDLSQYGVTHAACVDKEIVERTMGCSIHAKKDLNQREACCCIESVDIGSYDCCSHGCVYCYATTSQDTVLRNRQRHNKKSAILILKHVSITLDMQPHAKQSMVRGIAGQSLRRSCADHPPYIRLKAN
jgi:hypothetical protein